MGAACGTVEQAPSGSFGRDRSRRSFADALGDVQVVKDMEEYEGIYDVGDPVGSNDAVKNVTNKENQADYVSRAIPKSEWVLKDMSQIEEYLKNLRALEHIHICRFIEGFNDSGKQLELVYEKASSETLIDHLGGVSGAKGKIDEKIVCQYARQLVAAFSVAHRQDIVHGRLKDTSILCDIAEPDEGTEVVTVKICDMGQTFLLRDAKCTQSANRIEFAPPELLWEELEKPSNLKKMKANKKEYMSCDMWALGTILYRLLTGTMPFPGKGSSNPDLIEKIKASTVNFGPEWNSMPEARDVVHGLLIHANRLRMTAEKMLRHPWIAQGKEKVSRSKMMRVLQNVIYNSQESTFKKFAMRVIAEDMPTETLDIVEAAFRTIDKNGDGTVDRGEIKKVVAKYMADEEDNVEDIFNACDRDISGSISFAEFMAVSIGPREYCSKEKLWQTFNRFDRDKNGFFDKNEITTVFREVEHLAEGTQVEAEVEEIAKDVEMPVDFDTFVHVMFTPTGQPISKFQCWWGRTCNKIGVDVHKVRHIVPDQREGPSIGTPLTKSPWRRGTSGGGGGGKKRRGSGSKKKSPKKQAIEEEEEEVEEEEEDE